MATLLEMRGIGKTFPGVRALSNVNLTVEEGEIHAICGENGAGKSTLMKVLSGVYPHGSYEGEIHYDGAVLENRSIRDSEAKGIIIIHQELALVKHLTVLENIFLGAEISRHGLLDYETMTLRCQKLLAQVNLPISPDTRVGDLGLGQQQLVEIAKALNKQVRLLILDEPTASLTEQETATLLAIVRDLQNHDIACIYISHKLNEVKAISDTICVIRDGQHIGTRDASGMSEDDIITMMVGREIKNLFPREEHPIGEVFFEARNVTCLDVNNPKRKRVDNISFQLRKGEILGIAGLVGAGRTELAMAIFGCYPGQYSAELWLDGQKISVDSPRAAVTQGICLVPEDRKRHGIVPLQGVGANITMAVLGDYARYGVINAEEELCQIEKSIARMRIKTASPDLPIRGLSGGNQQKAVLSKMLLPNPKVLILDEPTRGVDVGAKYEIYKLMFELLRQGLSIIMISSELPEVLGISDRVLVIGEGQLRGDFINDGLTQEQVLTAALGQSAALAELAA